MSNSQERNLDNFPLRNGENNSGMLYARLLYFSLIGMTGKRLTVICYLPFIHYVICLSMCCHTTVDTLLIC